MPTTLISPVGFWCFAWLLLLQAVGHASEFPLKLKVDPGEIPQERVIRAMGPATNPAGETIGYDAISLKRNGEPWMPVMGEFHFSRYAPDQWLRELQKLKAGGIDIVATYLFWNHHEEREGEWNWGASRDIRSFVEAAAQAELKVFLRIGPWCHGEARYGGIPDWVVHGDMTIRSNDANYLAKVENWYQAIGEQVEGLMWAQGGPVVAVQLDNEYAGSSAHLLELKRLAIAAGLHVPLYTRTGWPKLQDLMPEDEMLPLFGVYAEGFWNHSLEPMPGKYREGFHFSKVRTSSDIGSDQLGDLISEDESEARRYPYLTCEVGGGMMNSYHRRVWIEPEDVVSTALVKFGSGGNLMGYYMYHGGWNPVGTYSTLQESLVTQYPNDMPVKNYDFQAPIGASGRLREHAHGLRQLHLFLRDYEHWVAPLQTFLPEVRPKGMADTATHRWSVRSDGEGGLLFFNNYERLCRMPERRVQYAITGLNEGALKMPMSPVVLEDGDFGFWPFRMEIAPGFEIEWITAQPLCRVRDDNGDWVVCFRQSGKVSPELAFKADSGLTVEAQRGTVVREIENGLHYIDELGTGMEPAVTLLAADGTRRCHLVFLEESQANQLWKGRMGNRDRLVLANSELVFRDGMLELHPIREGRVEFYLLPDLGAPPRLDGSKISSRTDGLWAGYVIPEKRVFYRQESVALQALREEGELRSIPLGPYKSRVAMAPVDADFEQAKKWRLPLPKLEALEEDVELMLQLDYVADVLRLKADGALWMDDFYNGRGFEAPVRELANTNGQSLETLDALELLLLPLQPDAPIYLHPSVRASLPTGESVVQLRTAHWILRSPIRLHVE